MAAGNLNDLLRYTEAQGQVCVCVSALVLSEYVKLTGWKEAMTGILTCVC